jgi:hypothetical protein
MKGLGIEFRRKALDIARRHLDRPGVEALSDGHVVEIERLWHKPVTPPETRGA